MLIAYYSHSGNTRAVANQLHEMVGGDIVELQTVTAYPDSYEEATKQAKDELRSGFMPPLKTKIKDIASHEVVFVGSPNWWGTFAAPVKTFLSEYDLSGKTIIPFITHAGSGLGHGVEDIVKLCPRSIVLDGLAIWGREAENSREALTAWLRGLEMLG